MPTILRRLILWSIICVVSAAPSFVIASGEKFDRGAMIVGVILFIAAYTIVTSTEAFERFHRRPFMRRTLYIGYGLRLLMSAAFPLGIDFIPGILSVELVGNVLDVEIKSFLGTLLTTIVQGAILNIIIFVIMSLAYAFQRMFMTPPPDFGPKGFDVVIPSTPTPVTRV